MAVNGYTERQYERLVRQVNDDENPTLRSKRLHDDSSYEVLIMHWADQGLHTNIFKKDKYEDPEESPIEQAKKRKRRIKKVHRLTPGPKSGHSRQSHGSCSLRMDF